MTGRVGIAALASALLVGCGGHSVPAQRGPHGNLHAELARASGGATALVSPPPPTVVLVERGRVRAIDPDSGTQLWVYKREVVGHPVASDRAIYLPLRGNRLAALDRVTGTPRWITELPGEALTGLAVSEPVLAATVLDRQHGTRSRIVALSTDDGSPQWTRDSLGRLGAPAARGRVFVVPVQDSVVALRVGSGREVARVALATGDGAALHAVEATDDALIVGGGNRFVNLQSETGGHTPAPQHVDTGYGILFPFNGGFDPGFDDGERLALQLSFPDNGEAPRQGVLMSRRVVMSMRLAPDGRPLRARWVHDSGDHREYVAMDVGERRITLVREDGAILELDTESGDVLHSWAGLGRARGALLLDLHGDVDRGRRDAGPDPNTLRAQLSAVLDDEDPRLLPAQILATELLWRDDDVASRRIVDAVADGHRGPIHTEAGQRLASAASALRRRSWGSSDEQELAERLQRLARRPSFLADRAVPVVPLAEQAVHSGNPAMVRHLVEHLMHPATPAEDLPEVARALGILGGPTALQALVEFVNAYHADPDIVAESRAVQVAVDQLAARIADRLTGAALTEQVRRALQDAVADPFTEPQLRAHIERTLRALGDGPGEVAVRRDSGSPAG